MTGPVIIDTNLLLLLIVGSADRKYIEKHKRLNEYTGFDFELLGLIIAEFSDIILLPHILAEVSSLARQIENPAKSNIQAKLKELIESAIEVPIPSIYGVQRDEFDWFGSTDAVILELCTINLGSDNYTLLTADEKLANQAMALGYNVLSYRDL